MSQEEKDYYAFVSNERIRMLEAEIDSVKTELSATIDAQASALSAKDEMLARYQAMYGPLPSQQPPAAPQA